LETFPWRSSPMKIAPVMKIVKSKIIVKI